MLLGIGYYTSSVGIPLGEFLKALEKDKELKKFILYQRVMFGLIRTKPGRFKVNFIFNPKGSVK